LSHWPSLAAIILFSFHALARASDADVVDVGARRRGEHVLERIPNHIGIGQGRHLDEVLLGHRVDVV
jgi:hypothetical protein